MEFRMPVVAGESQWPMITMALAGHERDSLKIPGVRKKQIAFLNPCLCLSPGNQSTVSPKESLWFLVVVAVPLMVLMIEPSRFSCRTRVLVVFQPKKFSLDYSTRVNECSPTYLCADFSFFWPSRPASLPQNQNCILNT